MAWCWLGALQLGQEARQNEIEASWSFLETSLKKSRLGSALLPSTRVPWCLTWKHGSHCCHCSDSLQPPGLNCCGFSCSVGNRRLREAPQPQAGMGWAVDWTWCWDDKCILASPSLHPQLSHKWWWFQTCYCPNLGAFWGHLRVLRSSSYMLGAEHVSPSSSLAPLHGLASQCAKPVVQAKTKELMGLNILLWASVQRSICQKVNEVN